MTTPSPFTHVKARRHLTEKAIHALLFLAALISVFTTAGIVVILLLETVGFFQDVSFWSFITDTKWTPLFEPKHFGILPLLVGTLLVTACAAIVALPLGLAIAIYLSEYAPEGVRRTVKPALEILAGIPTIVYGYFALLFISPEIVQRLFPGTLLFNAASASIAVGILILPLVASLSEDAMVAVPRSLREGAYALGATKFEVATRVVVPAALSGIVASFLLAIARAIGETMVVALAAGGIPNLTWNPLDTVQVMTAYIVQVSLGDAPFGSIEYKSIFAVGMTLFVITLLLNILGLWVVRRFRRAY